MKNILIGSDIITDFNNKGFNYIIENIGNYIFSTKRFNTTLEYADFINDLTKNNINFVDISLIQFIKLSNQ